MEVHHDAQVFDGCIALGPVVPVQYARMGQDTQTPSSDAETCTWFMALVDEYVTDPAALNYFRSPSPTECAAGILGMTETEVRKMMKTGTFMLLEMDDSDSYRVNPTVPAPENLVTDHTHTDFISHVHDAAGGHIQDDSFLQHNRDEPYRLDHWWYHAGEAQDHIIVGVAIPHHEDHFHKTEILTSRLNVPSSQQPYRRYRNVDVSGQYRNRISTGVYEAYRITVEYEY